MELIAIGAILSVVHAPVAVVASGVVVDVVEGHGEDVEMLESDRGVAEEVPLIPPSFYRFLIGRMDHLMSSL